MPTAMYTIAQGKKMRSRIEPADNPPDDDEGGDGEGGDGEGEGPGTGQPIFPK